MGISKFLLITAVILPVLPDRDIGPFQINPSRTWPVVVAVSAVSYGSYVLRRLTAGQGGVLLSAVLGGAYSSTVTTVVLARTASREGGSRLLGGHPDRLRNDVPEARTASLDLQPG